jgi:hypothetical protein
VSERQVMNDQLTSDHTLFRYLLDQLSEDERAVVEERFLSDGEYYEQLLVVEDELRFAYAKGSLPAAEREQFEKRFLIFPDERKKVELAKAMIGELSTMTVEKPTIPLRAREEERSRWASLRALFGFRHPAMGFALATATMVILATLVWMAFETSRLRSKVSQLQSSQTKREQELEQQSAESRARVEQLHKELEEERQNRTLLEQELAARREQPSLGEQVRTAIISLILAPGQIRGGGETRQLTIEQDSAQARLLLNLGEKNLYRSYQAVIRNSEGEPVWSRAGLRASLSRGAQFVVLTIPTRQLAEDDYEINLKGLTESGEAERIGDYYFTVLKK